MQIHDSHTFLAAGLASAIVLAMAGFALAAWLAYKLYRISDQVEQVLDAWTPSMAEALDTAEDDALATDEFSIPVEYKDVGGLRIRVRSDVAEREVAVRQAGSDAGEDVQDLRGRRPSPHAARSAPRAKVHDSSQRREAP